MRISIILITFFVCLCFFSKAQKYEFGIFAGASNYQGDLAGGTVVLKETQPAGGLLVRFSPLNYLSFKMAFTASKLSGNDKNFKDVGIRQRGYSFTSNIREFAAFTEFHLPQFGSDNSGMFRARFSPFIFVGVGITTLTGEPQAPKDGSPYPFPEFDARKKFICLPMGGGLKLRFSKSFATSIEWGTRTVFNDYLDGISKNGNPNANDWYMFGGISLTYVIDGGDNNPHTGKQ